MTFVIIRVIDTLYSCSKKYFLMHLKLNFNLNMIIRVITFISVFVSHCASMATGNVQGHLSQSVKTAGTTGTGSSIGQRVTDNLRCASDNLYYRGRQTGSRGLLPRVREDLVNRVLLTVQNTNELAEKMIIAIKDGTLDLSIARQLDETRELAETRRTTTTTEAPDVPEVPGVPDVLFLEQSGEYAILDETIRPTLTEAVQSVVTETIRPRPIADKLTKQIVVPVVSLSSEEESTEDNTERRSRRRCFYNRLLEDVSVSINYYKVRYILKCTSISFSMFSFNSI